MPENLYIYIIYKYKYEVGPYFSNTSNSRRSGQPGDRHRNVTLCGDRARRMATRVATCELGLGAKPSAEIARVGRLNVCKNLPTPALTKAGAAPGTTGGVEPALSRPWPSHSSNNCFSVFQRFATPQRPQTRRGSSHDQTFPQAFPRQLSQLHGPAICFSGRWSSVCPPSNASNP